MSNEFNEVHVPASFGRPEFLPLVKAVLYLGHRLKRLIDKTKPAAATPLLAEPATVGFRILCSATTVLAVFVICDSVAEAIAFPVPGAAIGMLLLLAYFGLRGGPDRETVMIFDRIAPHIPIFFIPAAAGIVANYDVGFGSWIAILFAIVPGTAITLICTGRLMQALLGGSRPGAVA